MQENTANSLATLSLKRLELLHLLFATHSLAYAAEEMHLSLSAASRQLTQARMDLDDELFVRSGYTMTPTDRMIELAPKIAAALQGLRDLLPESAFDPGQIRQTFHVSAADIGFVNFIAPVLPQIQRIAPRLSLVITPPHSGISEDLRSGRLDMAIFPQMPDETDLHSLQLGLFTLSLLMRADHPVAKAMREHGTIQPEELFRWPQVTFNVMRTNTPSFFKSRIDETLAKYGHDTPTLSLPYFNSAPFMLLESDYIQWIPTYMAKQWCRSEQFFSFVMPEFKTGFTPHLFWHRRSDRNLAHQWLRSMIAAAAKETAG